MQNQVGGEENPETEFVSNEDDLVLDPELAKRFATTEKRRAERRELPFFSPVFSYLRSTKKDGGRENWERSPTASMF